MLSDEQITKFQTLYKNRFGREISRQRAYGEGIKLMRLVQLIYKPMSEAGNGNFTNWLSVLNKIRTFFKENPDADF